MKEPCALCLEVVDGTNRLGGMNVCDLCLHRDVTEYLETHFGFQIEERRSERLMARTQSGEEFYRYHLTLKVIGTQRLDIHATFAKRGFGNALKGLFGGRLKVGDPLFDNNVHISTKSKRKLLPLLTEPCQSAVMELIEACGQCELGTTTQSFVLTRITQEGQPPMGLSARRLSGILLLHLQNPTGS